MKTSKTQDNGAEAVNSLFNKLEKGGNKKIWALYPFKEGAFCRYYLLPDDGPKFGSAREPDTETLAFVERVIDAPLTFAGLKAFLQTKCNAQNLDSWTWTEILWAIHYYDIEHDMELHGDETSILQVLDNSGEPLVKKTIAELTGLKQSSVRSRLNKLVERGYAKNSKPNGKSGFVSTSKGIAYLKKRGYYKK